MERKLTLFGILGIVAILVLSGFRPSYIRTPNKSSSSPSYIRTLSKNVFSPSYIRTVRNNGSGLAAPVMACLPEAPASNFRSPQVFNSRYIPPLDVTSSLVNTTKACAPGESADNFRFAHIWNGYFIPSMDVTASLAGSGKPFVPAVSAGSLVSVRVPRVFSGH